MSHPECHGTASPRVGRRKGHVQRGQSQAHAGPSHSGHYIDPEACSYTRSFPGSHSHRFEVRGDPERAPRLDRIRTTSPTSTQLGDPDELLSIYASSRIVPAVRVALPTAHGQFGAIYTARHVDAEGAAADNDDDGWRIWGLALVDELGGRYPIWTQIRPSWLCGIGSGHGVEIPKFKQDFPEYYFKYSLLSINEDYVCMCVCAVLVHYEFVFLVHICNYVLQLLISYVIWLQI